MNAEFLKSSKPVFNEWLVIIYSLFGLFVFYSGWRAHHPYLIDDAFITFRFARNLALGHGIVWNIGEETIEGYSSPLMLVAMVPSFRAGMEALVYARIMGMFCNVIAIPGMLFWLISQLSWSRKSSLRLLANLLPGTWLMSQSTLIHTLSGMETALACALYLAYAIVIGLIVQKTEPEEKSAWVYLVPVIVISILVFLVRSEGGALACLGFLTLFLFPKTRKHSLVAAACFFSFLGLYLLWKYFYFGYLLPTPYYHKISSSEGFVPGLIDVWKFLDQHLPLCLLILSSWIIVLPSGRSKLTAYEIVALMGFVFYSLFFLRVEHIMGFNYRFNWTTMPLLLLLGVFALWRLSVRFIPDQDDGHSDILNRIIRIGVVIAFGVLMLMRFPTMATLVAMAKFTDPPVAAWLQDGPSPHEKVGRILGDLDLSYDTTIDGKEAGIIPYFAGTRTNDSVGLTSLVFTHSSPEEIEDYLQKYPYDVFFIVSTSGAVDDSAVDLEWVASDPTGVREHSRDYFLEYSDGYAYAGSFYWGVDTRRQFMNLWVRKAHPRSREITEALGGAATKFDPTNFRFGPYNREIIENLKLATSSEAIP